MLHIEEVEDRRAARAQAVPINEIVGRFVQDNQARFRPPDGSAADSDTFEEIAHDLAKLAPVTAVEMIDENDPRVR